MSNQIVWVDIPCTDIDRAARFYSAVLAAEVQKQQNGGEAMAFLPHADGSGVSGCIYVAEKYKPGAAGPMIYLNCDGRLDAAADAVAGAGGTVLEPPHSIGPHGFRAVVLDSEGNRIGLHSR